MKTEKYIFVDTETSGLNAYSNQILQLSYIITDTELNVLEAKNFYLDVDVAIEIGAERTHGISKEKIQKLSSGKKFKDVAIEVKEDFINSRIICHNVRFDVTFIEQEFKRLGQELDYNSTFCTMEHYTDILEIENFYGYKWPKLEEVVYFLGLNDKELIESTQKVFKTLDNVEYHDARLDVYTTLQIFKAIQLNYFNILKYFDQ